MREHMLRVRCDVLTIADINFANIWVVTSFTTVYLDDKIADSSEMMVTLYQTAWHHSQCNSIFSELF
jgi:hypothetical protein